MSAETAFLIEFGGIVAQIVMLTAFYFVVFRRLFLHPSSNNFLLILLFLVFFQLGYPVVFLWGWVQSGRRRIVRLMTFWMMANVLFVAQMVILVQWEKAIGPLACIAIVVVTTTGIAALLIWGIVPFLRTDERLRNLQRDPEPQRIAQIAAMGPAIIPELQMLLADEYLPTRLAVIDCLSAIGKPAQTALLSLTDDADTEIASAARDAIERLSNPS